jgi:hypothetical protein
MLPRQKLSAFGILSWMTEHSSLAYVSLDELTAQFDVTEDQMQEYLKTLQRSECVKRGGRENAEWSITDRGRVRLAEGRFSASGAFLSPYDQRVRPATSTPDDAQPKTMIPVPWTVDAQEPRTESPGSSPQNAESLSIRWGRGRG